MKKAIFIALVLLSAVSLYAGGNSEKKQPDAQIGPEWITSDSDDKILPGINPLMVKGNIVSAGSSTVFPLSERIAERFTAEGYSGRITIDSIGSGAGFERFCVAGETDISNASVPMPDAQRQKAKLIGRNVVEFRVGTDALAVVVSKNNTFIKNATKDDLRKIFSDAKKWSDIKPEWPDREIERFIPGTDSGTFDYFVEAIFKKDKKPILSAGNLQMSEDDNILVQGIAGSPYSIGFFGYAYFKENLNQLNILQINGIAASDETVDNGSYPLARPLFIYTSENIIREKPQVAAFIAYYLTYVNDEIRKVGYFPANTEALDKSKQEWMQLIGSTK